MTDGSDPLPVEPPRHWPRERAPAADESVAANCAACGAPWQVHRAMAGFRLRCDCGGWIAVPAPATPAALTGGAADAAVATRDALGEGADQALALRRASRDAQGRIELHVERGDLFPRPISTSLPMAPGTVQEGTAETRAKWTSRALIEFCLMIVALVGPAVGAMLLARGREDYLLLPFASLTSAALVAIVAAASGPYGTAGWCRAAPQHFGLAIVLAVGTFGLAVGWVEALRGMFGDRLLGDPYCHDMREELGFAWTMLVMAVSPAVLEEWAFRGVLQGRLLALLGLRNGLLVTAAAFAVCHGPTAAFFLHFGLGWGLGWLRERSGSLLPGMLLHFTYNGLIVVAT